ncbi:hypothetical protein F4810DRAFT_716547 [Camillea tinctor]|nr:hypothetical protein F4810DRAFT_716547 [Camillea tinctor]
MTNCMLGIWTDPDVELKASANDRKHGKEAPDIEQEMPGFGDTQGEHGGEVSPWQLGRSHPETLESYLRQFTVRLFIGEDQEPNEIYNFILKELRSTKARNERPVEILLMQRKLAIIYASKGRHVKATAILRNIIQAIRQCQESVDEGVKQSLDSLLKTIEPELHRERDKAVVELSPELKEIEQKVIFVLKTDDWFRADEIQSRIWELLNILYGEDNDEAPSTLPELVTTTREALKQKDLSPEWKLHHVTLFRVWDVWSKGFNPGKGRPRTSVLSVHTGNPSTVAIPLQGLAGF